MASDANKIETFDGIMVLKDHQRIQLYVFFEKVLLIVVLLNTSNI